MKIIINILLINLFFFNILKGQEKNVSLLVGDSLPNLEIPKIFNFSRPSINTSSYKNKLLIIDLWGTTCKTCIEALPKMERLQQMFVGNLQILLVTTEKEKMIKNFWYNNKYTKHLSLPSVVEDKIFSNLFKYAYLPHEVWIYKNKVIAITSADYVDEHNIKRVLEGQKVNWPIKNDFYNTNSNTPLFALDSTQVDIDNTVIEYAAIGGSREKMNSSSNLFRDSKKNTIRFCIANQPILNSYFYCYSQIIQSDTLLKPFKELLANQVQWQVQNKSRYAFNKDVDNYYSSWLRENGICFESLYVNKGQNSKEIFESAISDLNRLLGLDVRWERKNRKVWIVTQSKIGIKAKKEQNVRGKTITLHNIIMKLNDVSENPYVFIENAEPTAEIAFDIRKATNLNNVREALKISGFDMVERQMNIDMLIFSEIKGPVFPLNVK
jgi:thiol-disulfide isomerase/thioredoxin